MKIVLLSGASSIHTIRWANGLSAAGLSVHLITQHPALEAMDPSVTVYTFPYRGVIGYFSMVPGVKKLLRKIQPDILNAHYASGYATTARLAGFHPWLLSVWGSDVYDFPYKSWLHKYWVGSNLLSADSVASTSYSMAEQTRLVAPGLNKIFITPFGVDTEKFSVPPASLEYGSTDGSLVIGTVKALAPKYGVDTLIEAFSLLYQKFQKTQPALADRLRLRLVGDGPQREYLQGKVKSLGLDFVTDFVGYVPHSQVFIELKKLDIYVALSRQESFGVAIIEAGAAAKPVVVSDVGGLPEVVKHNETGLIVPSDDPQAASEAIVRLIESPELRHGLGQSAQKLVRKKYAWSSCVNNMIGVFREVVEKNNL